MSPLGPELLPSQGIFGDASSGSSTIMQPNLFSSGCGFADPFAETGLNGSSGDIAAPTYLGSREDGVFVFGSSTASPQEATLSSHCEVGGTRRRAAASRMRRCRRAVPKNLCSRQGAEDDATVWEFEAPSASPPGGSTESANVPAKANECDVPCGSQHSSCDAAGISSDVAPSASKEPAPDIFRFGVQHGASSSAQQEPAPSIFKFGVQHGASSSTEYCSGSTGAGATTEPPIFRFGMQPQEQQQQQQTECTNSASESVPMRRVNSSQAFASAPATASSGQIFSFGSNPTVLRVPWGGVTPGEAAQSPFRSPAAATFVPTERSCGGYSRVPGSDERYHGGDPRRQVRQRRRAHEDVDEGPDASATTPAAHSPSGTLWQRSVLEEVRTHANQQHYAEAVQACLPVLSGPQEAVALLTQICRSWEKVGQDRVREHEEEMRSRMSQLMAARDRSETFRRAREKAEIELQNERRHREESHEQYVRLRRQYDEVLKENKKLKQQAVKEAYKARAAPAREEVVRQMAEFECGPLRQCSYESRVAIKKKLLLKWHPDKQPSVENATLATAVMQELQNRPEWEE